MTAPTDTSPPSRRHRSAAMLERMKGGHLWTVLVNQRLASQLAVWLGDRGYTPNQVSLGNLAVGLSTSGLVVLLVGVSPPMAALVAFFGWQLAYTLDCADGQLARTTGQTSPEGFIIDLLCDYLVQTSVAVAVLFVAAPALPDGRLGMVASAALMGAFLINVFVSALGTSTGLGHRAATSIVIEAIRSLVRDWGILVVLYAVAIGFGAWPVLAVIVTLSVVNVLFVSLKLVGFVRVGMPEA